MEASLKSVDFVVVRQADRGAFVMRGVFLLLVQGDGVGFVGDAQERLRGSGDAIERDIVLAFFRIDVFEPVDGQIERKIKDARDGLAARLLPFCRPCFGHRLFRLVKLTSWRQA